MHGLAWLKRMNARGHDVHIQPHGAHGLVLVDGLTPAGLKAMGAKGLTPAATLETFKGHFQAWIKLSDRPVEERVRTAMAAEITKHYAPARELGARDGFGRLAGFTNQNDQHPSGDRQSFVLLHNSHGKIAESASVYLEKVAQALRIASQSKTLTERDSHHERGRGHSR